MASTFLRNRKCFSYFVDHCIYNQKKYHREHRNSHENNNVDHEGWIGKRLADARGRRGEKEEDGEHDYEYYWPDDNQGNIELCLLLREQSRGLESNQLMK